MSREAWYAIASLIHRHSGSASILEPLYHHYSHETIVRTWEHWRAKQSDPNPPRVGLFVNWVKTDLVARDKAREAELTRIAEDNRARKLARSKAMVRADHEVQAAAAAAIHEQEKRDEQAAAAADAAWAQLPVEVLDTATRIAESDPGLSEMERVVLRKLVEHGRLRESDTGRQIVARYLPREVLAQLPVQVVTANVAQAASA